MTDTSPPNASPAWLKPALAVSLGLHVCTIGALLLSPAPKTATPDPDTQATIVSLKHRVAALERAQREDDDAPSPLAPTARRTTAVNTTTGGTTGAPVQPKVLARSIKREVSRELGDQLEQQLEQRIQRERTLQRYRNRRGDWQGPVDDLSRELELTEPQKKRVTEIFNKAKDDMRALYDTKREDGTSLLSDYEAKIKKGTPRRQARREMFRSMRQEKVPGTDQTYREAMRKIRTDTSRTLGEELDTDQASRLEQLRIDPLRIQTGHNPMEGIFGRRRGGRRR